MAKPKAQHREAFEVEHNGKTYACQRVITGTITLSQRIYVIGVGSKDDSANYGRRGHPISTMAGIARIIAGEIIREAEMSRPHS